MSRPLTVADLANLLPDLEETRPILDRILLRSAPDPSRMWAGSGVLGAAGDRVVHLDDPAAELRGVFEEEEAHRRGVLEGVARALECRLAGDLEGCARAFLESAALEEARMNFARAEACADAAWRSLEAVADSGTRRRALRRRARARRSRGDYQAAGSDYRRAFELAAASADVQGAAEAAIGAGNCSEDQAKWDDALDWYRRAADAMEEAGYAGPERWQVLLNEHIVRRSRGDLEEAAATLERAATAAEPFDGAEIFLDNARGQLLLAMGHPDEAEHHLRAALARRPGGRAQVTIRLNLAETLLAAGRLLEAAEEVRTAEYEAITGRAHAQLPEAYRLLGRVSAARGEGDAFVLFEKSLTLIDEHDLPAIERARTLEAWADHEAGQGDHDRADRLRSEAATIRAALGAGTPDSAAHDNEQDNA